VTYIIINIEYVVEGFEDCLAAETVYDSHQRLEEDLQSWTL